VMSIPPPAAARNGQMSGISAYARSY
jgi:hypothetical protein